MYAVVEIAGRQYKVAQNDKISIPSSGESAGATVMFDRVLLLETGDGVKVGTPLVAGATVKGTVLANEKSDKVIVFKKKRRKGYRVKRGHRQGHTNVEITSIA